MGDVLRIAKTMVAKSDDEQSTNNGSGTSEREVNPAVIDMDDLQVCYYVRLAAIDQFGVLAKVAGVFGDAHISIASVLQFDSDDERGLADLVIMTHPSREANMQEAATRLRQLDVVASLENLIRVEDYDEV